MSGQRQKQGLWLDPRTKLFLILICVLASMFAPSLAYQFALVVLIAVLGAFFGKWKYIMKAVCFYGHTAHNVRCLFGLVPQSLRLWNVGWDHLENNESQ